MSPHLWCGRGHHVAQFDDLELLFEPRWGLSEPRFACGAHLTETERDLCLAWDETAFPQPPPWSMSLALDYLAEHEPLLAGTYPAFRAVARRAWLVAIIRAEQPSDDVPEPHATGTAALDA